MVDVVVAVERLDYMFYEVVPHYVALVELDETYTLYAAHSLHRTHQSAIASTRQIYLRNVARNDEPGIATHAGKEHLYL